MNISISIDGNNPLMHVLGFTTHYLILLITILFVYDFFLAFPNIFLKKDPWRWNISRGLDISNIYNWANWIWNLMWYGVIGGMAFFIVEAILTAILCVRITL